MASKAQKRKNKKKYYQPSKKSKCFSLEVGMKGFLITCNDEHRCVKEAYNLLNEFADEMYGPEFKERNDDSEDMDITKMLAREISVMKSERRFQQVATKVKGILFINTTIPDPTSLVNKIFKTVLQTGKKNTRFILRFQPVVATCKAHETDLRKVLDTILLQCASDEKNKELKYKVESKVRFNDSVTSSHLVWYVRDSVKSTAINWTACILKPEIIISFYVLRSVCCISILSHYEEYKKYNLSAVATPAVENPKSQIIPNIKRDKIEMEEVNAKDGIEEDLDAKDEIGEDVSAKDKIEDLDAKDITSETVQQISSEE